MLFCIPGNFIQCALADILVQAVGVANEQAWRVHEGHRIVEEGVRPVGCAGVWTTAECSTAGKANFTEYGVDEGVGFGDEQ